MIQHAIDSKRMGLARCAVLLLALAVAALVAVPAALADEGVTRSMHGVNYTLPADWEEVEVSDEVGDAIDENVTGGSVEYALYHKNDGLFAIAALPGDDSTSLTEDELALLAPLLVSCAVDSPFGSVDFSFTVEQGLPTFTAQTNDIYLNGVVYELTAKMYGVSDPDFVGYVLMVSLLPESGQVSEDFLENLPVAGANEQVELGGVSYTIPQGATYLTGGAFGFDFVIADCGDPEGVFIGLGIPQYAEDFAVTLADLESFVANLDLDVISLTNSFDRLTYDLATDYGIEIDQSLEFTSAWADAFGYGTFPALGAEFDVTVDGASYYFGLLGLVLPGDYSLGIYIMPSDGTFADEILNSMVVSEEYATVAAESEEDAAGFTVGM